MAKCQGRLWRRGKSLSIQIAATLISQSVTANTVLTTAWIFAGSINGKWLALTAFTLRERRWGRGWVGCKQRVGCHGEETGWLSCVDRGTAVISYLSPLFGLNTLRVQHHHWEERERAEEYIVTKQSQSSILLLLMVFVLLLLCWHSSLIILPRPDSIMKCQAWWCCAASNGCYDVHMQREKPLKRDWKAPGAQFKPCNQNTIS